MTNQGLRGFPSAADVVPDGSITPGKLASPMGWGRLASGRYYFPACSVTNIGTSGSLSTGVLRIYPWFVPNAVTVSVIGAEITSGGESGSKLRLGLYADNGTSYPGQLVLDAGTIAGDSGTVQDISVNVALQPGLYWIGGVVQVVSVTQPTVRVIQGNPIVPVAVGTSTPAANTVSLGYSQSSVTGALPAAFTSTIATVGSAPRMHIKVA